MISGGFSIGSLMRMGLERLEMTFSEPSRFLKPMDVTGVAVVLDDCAVLVLDPKVVMPICKTLPLSPRL